MKDPFNIQNYPEFLKEAMQLASDYHLRVGHTETLDYFFIGTDFAILFLLARDGNNLTFVELPSTGKSFTYALGHFLYDRRRKADIRFPAEPGTLSPSVVIPIELAFYLELLRASPDILKGGREWQREYETVQLQLPEPLNRDPNIANHLSKKTTPALWFQELHMFLNR